MAAHWNLSNLKLHPYAIFTRSSWWPSVILETTQPGEEATLKTHAALGPKKFLSIWFSFSCMCLDSRIKAIESIIMSMKYLSSYWCLISGPNTGIFQVFTEWTNCYKKMLSSPCFLRDCSDSSDFPLSCLSMRASSVSRSCFRSSEGELCRSCSNSALLYNEISLRGG